MIEYAPAYVDASTSKFSSRVRRTPIRSRPASLLDTFPQFRSVRPRAEHAVVPVEHEHDDRANTEDISVKKEAGRRGEGEGKKRREKMNLPRHTRHPANPQKHQTRHSSGIMPIHDRRSQLPARNRRGVRALRRDLRPTSRQDHRKSNSVRETHCCHDDGGNAPGPADVEGFPAVGEEEVEEKRGAEDGGDADADEDVEGGDAHEVVVVDCRGAVQGFDFGLLVDVV